MVAYQLQDIRFVVYQKDLYVGIRHVKNVLVRLSGSKVKKMETGNATTIERVRMRRAKTFGLQSKIRKSTMTAEATWCTANKR